MGRLRAIRKTPKEEPQCDLACERDSGVPPWNEAWRRTSWGLVEPNPDKLFAPSGKILWCTAV